MSNCNEYLLDDLKAITAIPVSDIPASDIDSPVNKFTPTISKATFHPTLAHAITIGRERLDLTVEGGTANKSVYLVPIQNCNKPKDGTSDSVAGRLHTVSVDCEVDERGGEIWAPINAMDNTPCSLRLQRTPHHLVLSFRDGKRGFVAANEDTYTCTIERDGSKVGVAFKIQNLMGIQMLV